MNTPNAHIVGATLDDVLHDVIVRVLKDGVRITPTKGEALELSGTLLEIENPRARLSRTETRGKIFSALGEFCWYLTGTNNAEFITYYIKPYAANADDGIIHGGYGPRLFDWHGTDQVHTVIDILRRKPDSRQAVIQIFDRLDLLAGKRDIPCTCSLQFMLRANKLTLLTYMRSNDIHWGLPHDVFCFTMLQEVVARTLGVELGTYKHFVGSLHLYVQHEGPAKRCLKEGWQATFPVMPPMPDGDPWQNIRSLLRLEEEIRLAGTLRPDDEQQLPDYWMDLARLLHVFRLKRNRDLSKLEKLRGELSCELYRPFVDRAIRSLAAARADG